MEHGNNSTKVVNNGRWTSKEHVQFLDALRVHGQDWRRIAWDLKTRNNVQVRTHAQKYFKKLERMKRRAALRESIIAGGKSKSSKRARRAVASSSEEESDEEDNEEDEEQVSEVSQDTESDTDESDKGQIVKSPSEATQVGEVVQPSAIAMAAVRTIPQSVPSHPGPVAPPMAHNMMRMPMSIYSGAPQQQQQHFVLPHQQVQMNYFRPFAAPVPQWGSAPMMKSGWQVQSLPTAFHVMPHMLQNHQQQQQFVSQPTFMLPVPDSVVYAKLSTPSRQQPF